MLAGFTGSINIDASESIAANACGAVNVINIDNKTKTGKYFGNSNTPLMSVFRSLLLSNS
jgi:hypothetical protein